MKSLIRILSIFLVSFLACKKGGDPKPVVPDPRISINDISITEGNSGSTAMLFRVSLSSATTKQVTVSYTTVEGTAKNNEDFVPASNVTITFLPNEVEKNISIPAVADDARESDDVFTVMLSSPVNATIDRQLATGIIVNDDTRVPFTNNGYDAPTTYSGYTLAWADEFNGTSLNTAFWTNENGDGCPGICGWGNNELEYYTDRPENIFFQDGKMIIEARKESLGGKNYTSSKIVSRGKKVFKFGRIDIRAKLPKGKGIWPALWMLPQSNVHGGWPRSGEIDIMEMIGQEPHRVFGTVHFGPGPGSVQISRSYTLSSGLFNDEFHVFSIEWKLNQIKWFVDGVLFSTVNSTDFGANTYPFNEDFFFIINHAVGGNWPGSPDVNTYFPQWLIVDYVRVYQ